MEGPLTSTVKSVGFTSVGLDMKLDSITKPSLKKGRAMGGNKTINENPQTDELQGVEPVNLVGRFARIQTRPDSLHTSAVYNRAKIVRETEHLILVSYVSKVGHETGKAKHVSESIKKSDILSIRLYKE